MPLVVILAILTIEYEHSSFITGIYRDNNVNYKYKKYIASNTGQIGKSQLNFQRIRKSKIIRTATKEKTFNCNVKSVLL